MTIDAAQLRADAIQVALMPASAPRLRAARATYLAWLRSEEPDRRSYAAALAKELRAMGEKVRVDVYRGIGRPEAAYLETLKDRCVSLALGDEIEIGSVEVYRGPYAAMLFEVTPRGKRTIERVRPNEIEGLVWDLLHPSTREVEILRRIRRGHIDLRVEIEVAA
jgi:hypothetical protein